MAGSVDILTKLTAKFRTLPGVGAKTAQRYALAVIDMTKDDVQDFANAMTEAKDKIRYCSVCGNLTDSEVCSICKTRDNSVICVVKSPRDVMAMEKLNDYKGVYHVLHGTLDPLNGVGPSDINLTSLLQRIQGVKEVIMATNPDPSGEATAQYIAMLLKPMNVKVTRLMSGLPANSDIEFADELTLLRALNDRKVL